MRDLASARLSGFPGDPMASGSGQPVAGDACELQARGPPTCVCLAQAPPRASA